ncbi:TPA: hypothetical protein HA241_04635 [Candidatus Woesearchaeota archaeon]|nr:hypothetical protein [Candidatus Woesearchaeota archaeon]
MGQGSTSSSEESRASAMLRNVFCYLARQGTGFRYDRDDVGRFFHAARKKFPDVVEGLHFQTRLTGDYCPAIEDAFEHLRSTGFITRRYSGYQLFDRFDVNQRSARRYTCEANPRLEELAAEFKEQFGDAN